MTTVTSASSVVDETVAATSLAGTPRAEATDDGSTVGGVIEPLLGSTVCVASNVTLVCSWRRRRLVASATAHSGGVVPPHMSPCRAVAMSALVTPEGTVVDTSVTTLRVTATVVVLPLMSAPPTAALEKAVTRSAGSAAETAEKSTEETAEVAKASGGAGGGVMGSGGGESGGGGGIEGGGGGEGGSGEGGGGEGGEGGGGGGGDGDGEGGGGGSGRGEGTPAQQSLPTACTAGCMYSQ